jgi:type II secretory pathway component PulF
MGARSRLAQAYYDLATMLDAGVPILRSIDIVIQGRKGALKRVFSQMRESLSKGANLSESMAEHRNVFPDLDRMLVETAETSGLLGESFKMLSQWHEFMNRITKRMMSGLIYPVAILHIAAFIFGVPDLVLGRLTWPEYLTRVIGVLLVLYIPMAVVIASIHLREKAPTLRLLIDGIALWVPVLGRAIYHLSISRYARAFAMLYKSGVPILETAERAGRATGNVVVAGLFAGGVQSVRQGNMVSAGFSKRLPPEYLHLWLVGEETGDLDKSVAKVAEIAADRADLYFDQFAQWMPRVVYFAIMGVMAYMILRLAGQVYGNLDAFM